MSGVRQVTYEIPEADLIEFVRSITHANLTAVDVRVSDAGGLYPLQGCADGIHPGLSIWPKGRQGQARKVDIHWLVGQEAIVRRLSAIACQFGDKLK